jgi:hypothetical protein
VQDVVGDRTRGCSFDCGGPRSQHGELKDYVVYTIFISFFRELRPATTQLSSHPLDVEMVNPECRDQDVLRFI